MKEFLLRSVLEWAADHLTTEKVDELEDAFVAKLLPYLQVLKDDLVLGLKTKASLSETSIDDTVVEAVDKFLSDLLERLEE